MNLSRRFDVLHMATHGFAHDRYPELSGLALAGIDKNGRPLTSFMSLEDLRVSGLAAELVVLSSCETAVGPGIAGEGAMSLSRAFLRNGSRYVLAGLWQVQDSATAELIGRFYRELLVTGLSPPAALRAAQRHMLDTRWRAPRYWAGFVLWNSGAPATP